jgi:hypothetical protein
MSGELVKDKELKGFIYYSQRPVGVEVGALGKMMEDKVKNDGLSDALDDVGCKYRKGFRATPTPEHHEQ